MCSTVASTEASRASMPPPPPSDGGEPISDILFSNSSIFRCTFSSGVLIGVGIITPIPRNPGKFCNFFCGVLRRIKRSLEMPNIFLGRLAIVYQSGKDSQNVQLGRQQ